MRDRPFDEAMIENFREDPAFATKLVNSILEDGDDQGELKIILGLIAAAGLRLSVVAPEQTKPRRRAGTTKPSAPKRAIRVRRSAVKTPALV